MHVLCSVCVLKCRTQYNTDQPGMLSNAFYGCHFVLVFIAKSLQDVGCGGMDWIELAQDRAGGGH
jgi:hypothetical protein